MRMRGLAMAAGLSVCSAAWASAPAPKVVAGFDQQVTGVAVSKTGRIFVNFPRWEKDVPVSVAEVMKDGSLKPYPNAEWNAWSNLHPLSLADHFVCVQSVTVDPQGYLWVVDPAAPGNEFVKPGGVKLVKNRLEHQCGYQGDPVRRDRGAAGQLHERRACQPGRHARLPDRFGPAWRLDRGRRGQRPCTPRAGRRPAHPAGAGRGADGGRARAAPAGPAAYPSFAADGIALDPAGQFVYWQALVGRTLYRVPTAALTGKLAPSAVAAKVETLGTTNVADGFWMDEKGYLFITDPADNAVRMRAPDGTLTMVAQDDRLRWPDSLAEGADGAIYVTASHIQDMAQFHTTGSTQQGQWQLFRIPSPHK